MKYKVPVKLIDGAYTYEDLELKKNIEFNFNKDYRFLTALPVFEDGWGAVVSKDAKEWVLCVGAFADGKNINVEEFMSEVEKMTKDECE